MGTSRVASKGQKELNLKHRGPAEGRRQPMRASEADVNRQEAVVTKRK